MRSRSTGCTAGSCRSRGCSTPARASRRSRPRWSEIERHLPEREVILYTSRELARAEGSDEALDVGRSVSDALVELVQRLDPGLPLAFCVAKGGITSSDIGTRGFGVRRAEVAGQMLPGTISVWILPEDSAFPGPALRDLPRQRRRGRDARRGRSSGSRRERRASASVLADAAAQGRAVGAFTCYDLLGFEAVVRAARGARRAGDRPGRPRLVRRARAASACSPRSAPPPRGRGCRSWSSSTTPPTAS